VNVLALESSTHVLSVALWRDGSAREHRETLPSAGSRYLLPWLSALLADAEMDIADVDAIAFGAGPGGFVGVRLACALAQGLAVGLGLPVLGVSTLEALAVASGGTDVYACMDARMGEVYAAAFRCCGGTADIVQAAGVFAPGEVPLPPPAAWVGVGDGFAVHGERLRRRLGGLLVDVRADISPSASAVAGVAALRLSGGGSGDVTLAQPIYIRDAVALTTAERLARGGVR
jgi:tRNA threonylcarbamoyladenosine biosynthesis protein TsaB